MRSVAIAFSSLLLVTATANAAWLEVSSEHFVIYSEQDEKTARGFAERLERFHAGMAFIFGRTSASAGPSSRVTVFVVSSSKKVRKVSGTANQFVAGLYFPRAGASVALVPRLGRATESSISGQEVLYHEYAHHFMWTNLTTRAYPRWFTEGFAECFGNTQFRQDGSLALGAPADHRSAELAWAREVPMETLLSFDGGYGDANSGYYSFYAQSWVLFHYLLMEKDRDGQLSSYQKLLAQGQPALDAARNAFGDLRTLESDMQAYMRRRALNAIVLPPRLLKIGAISLRKLGRGEDAMMPTMIESRIGVDREEALGLLPEARRIAALHPDDAAVLAALAAAEYDAGNDAAAISAADSALAIDPKQMNAHLQKGYALFRQVQNGEAPGKSWRDVRSQFVKANAVENDNPIPLVQFYRTFLEQGERPTQNAIEGLQSAMQAAPFDPSLRWLVVQQMISDARYAEAARTLAPLAYSAHPGEHTDEARRLLAEVEAKIEPEQEPSPHSPSKD